MEEKQYEYKGTVTISTEEYRDLVKGVFEAEKDAESYRSRYWEEQSKSRELEKKVEAQKKAVAGYADFVNASPARLQAYKEFLIEKRSIEEEINASDTILQY